jgi:arsenate reductase
MNKAIRVYGIPNCDSVKRARAWLSAQGMHFEFHDFAKQGVPGDRMTRWLEQAGWQTLVNRRGTTWRKLDTLAQDAVTDDRSARALMERQPSVIKRPVVEWDERVTVGFDPAAWEQIVRAGL